MSSILQTYSMNLIWLDNRGSVTTVISSLTFILVGFVAFVIDIGVVNKEHRSLQYAADAGTLSGVAKLKDPFTYIGDVRAESINFMRENKISQEEVSPTDILVGYYDLANNTLSQTMHNTNGYNAVAVETERIVPAVFGRIFGISQMVPSVRSTAVIGGASEATCLAPFAVEEAALNGLSYGGSIEVSFPSPGNWGKIDVDGNMSSLVQFADGMRNGVCSKTIRIGDTLLSAPGDSAVSNAFHEAAAENRTLIVAVIDEFVPGSSTEVTVMGFIVVQISGDKGKGRNWVGNLTLLDEFIGSSIGGPSGAPYARARALIDNPIITP